MENKIVEFLTFCGPNTISRPFSFITKGGALISIIILLSWRQTISVKDALTCAASVQDRTYADDVLTKFCLVNGNWSMGKKNTPLFLYKKAVNYGFIR